MASEPEYDGMPVLKFRRKQAPVEAIRYTAETCRACHQFLGLRHNDEADCGSGIVFSGVRAVEAAEVGDWIVCHDRQDGIFECYSDEEFREEWERVDD